MTKPKYLLLSIFAFLCSFTGYKLTHSYFTDKEAILGNSIQVGTWGEGESTPTPTEEVSLPESTPTPTPTPEPSVPTVTPTPTPTPVSPVAGSVVINEVMWMGSTDSAYDEWIELRNTTVNDISLTGWKIEGAGSGSNSIILSGTIPANSYFLLGNYASNASAINNTITVDQVTGSLSLVDEGEQLTLKDSANNIIDQTPAGNWPAGFNTSPFKKSMERNSDPLTGWHTCTSDVCNDTVYWDTEGNNYGTPKAANL
ncbi:MAG: lamin tail domain-containing protein [Microgenomates group bacterium]